MFVIVNLCEYVWRLDSLLCSLQKSLASFILATYNIWVHVKVSIILFYTLIPVLNRIKFKIVDVDYRLGWNSTDPSLSRFPRLKHQRTTYSQQIGQTILTQTHIGGNLHERHWVGWIALVQMSKWLPHEKKYGEWQQWFFSFGFCFGFRVGIYLAIK